MNNKYINSSFFYLRELPKALGDLFKNYRAEYLRVRNKPRLANDATQNDIFRAEQQKKDELAALKTETLKELADIRAAAETKREIAARHLEKELGARDAGGDIQTNLLNETREQKAWARIKPLLDRQTEIEPLNAEIKSLVGQFVLPLDSAPGAFDSSDFDSVAALKKELPFYVRGRFSEPEAAVYGEQANNALEAALADTRPAFREAFEMKKELATGMAQIGTAFNYLESAIEKNESETIIPIWTKGETAMLK